MAALVQTLPSQTTVTMLQGPPSPSFAPQHQPRRYHHPSGSGSYRGIPSGPIAPYAFTSTPQLTQAKTHQSPHLRTENRSVSAPILPQFSQLPSVNPTQSQHRVQAPTMSVLSSTSSVQPRQVEDAAAPSENIFPDFSSWGQPKLGLPESGSTGSIASNSAPKPSPDRYRRDIRKPVNSESDITRVQHGQAMSHGTAIAVVGNIYTHPHQASSSPALTTFDSYRGAPFHAGSQMRKSSADDMIVGRSYNTDAAKRYRRRSVGSIETAGLNHSNDSQEHVSPHPNAFLPSATPQNTAPIRHATAHIQRPAPTHQHKESSDSIVSVRSNHSMRPSSAKNDRPASPQAPSHTDQLQVTPVSKQEVKVVNISQRTGDPSKRNPSPLSRPANLESNTPTAAPSVQPTASPAAEQLAALSQKDAKKGKSKLRRAFSFGSATELRRASAQNNLEKNTMTPHINKRSSKHEEDLDPESARIAEKQEAGGIGHSIYSGQGNFFTGSTDNLSISSTASSASLMLRKMGKGMKKSTRSLVGLFRPKSVIGVPAADGPVTQGTAAQVSMVTVEAERQKVNVNVDPHDQPGGGTGFPKLERNSIDAKYSTDSGTASSSRRSIVGGERERVEVLAAVKKGILKRTDSGQSSPVARPYDFKAPDFNLPQIPHVNDSPRSSAPSTPADDQPPRSGHRRTDSVAIEGTESEDYFTSISRLTSVDSKGSPLTPRAGLPRNISFSPRIQFHDTWPSGEYDRRGEVATCNRLTPMLAQQIKEELNTFKMEMEVHESSKVYTHFF